MRPLPSLNALKVFEAVARHRSMSRAAEELCVTHGAVSRHIRSLEDTLGVLLLSRGARASEPTLEGARLAEGLASAFALIETSIDRVRPGPLTLSCSSSIMMEWIIPRIGRFHARHPHVEVQFNMNYDRIDFMRDKISIAIRASVIEPPPGAVIRDLGAEAIGPVCAPSYLAQCPISEVADLVEAALLGTRTRPQAFAEWQAAAGCEALALEPRSSFEHFYLLIQAAIFGLGVAMVPQMLVADHIAAKRLVAPLGFCQGPRRLVLWIAPHLAGHPDTLALERWLVREMRVLPQG